jgi:26S proteasome regulatory subunit N12
MDALRVAFKAKQYEQVIKLLPSLKLASLSSAETLELFTAASLVFLGVNDLNQFEKHASLVRGLIHQSANDSALLVVGLLLIQLLASDRIGDFHVALHLLPHSVLNHRFIQYPVDLERSIMEGNYAKVLRADRPSEFNPYITTLNDAVAGKAREVMLLASERKFAEAADPRSEAAASMKLLLSYAQDLQRIV